MKKFLLILGLVLLSQIDARPKKRKKGAAPRSAAAVAAAMAEAAAKADKEALEERQRVEEERRAEEERKALLPPEPEEIYCEDCEGNTGGQCKNAITNYCVEKDGDTGLCPEGYDECLPYRAPCADDDNEEECWALMTIANHTGYNVTWTNAGGWGRGGPYCSWYGVVCDEKKEHVKELYLDNNNLTGPILSFEGLIWLEILHLQDNPRLNGTIPDFGLVTELQIINLGNNGLTGKIPDLFTMPKLRELYLEMNQLTGTIPDLYGLEELQVLQLYSNQLQGMIPSLASSRKLEYFMLHENRLRGEIPSDYYHAQALKVLSLHTNILEGDVPDLSVLPQIEYIHLYDNMFTAIDPGLCALLVGKSTIRDTPARSGKDKRFRVSGDCRLDGNPFLCEFFPQCAQRCGATCNDLPEDELEAAALGEHGGGLVVGAAGGSGGDDVEPQQSEAQVEVGMRVSDPEAQAAEAAAAEAAATENTAAEIAAAEAAAAEIEAEAAASEIAAAEIAAAEAAAAEIAAAAEAAAAEATADEDYQDEGEL